MNIKRLNSFSYDKENYNLGKKYYRDDLQLIDSDNLIKDTKHDKQEILLDELSTIKPEDVLNMTTSEIREIYKSIFGEELTQKLTEKN